MRAVVFAGVVDSHDAGMIQPTGGGRFVVEAGDVFGGTQASRTDDFEGHRAADFLLMGFINHTHATTADLLDEQIVADLADVVGIWNLSGRVERPR
jgi:hypothetical protein